MRARSPLATALPRRLSGGQQQRVALARALVIRPRILLLDEPLSNLDAKLREDMQIELRQIQRTIGTTTILVTHDQSEAMALSDRIVVMNRGRVEQTAPPQEAYERPATPFVASFLGRTNVLEMRLNANGAQIGDGQWAIAAGAAPAMVSIRPEKIAFAPSDQANAISGTIKTRIFQGNHWLYQVDTSAGLVIVHPPERGRGRTSRGRGGTLGLACRRYGAAVRGRGSSMTKAALDSASRPCPQADRASRTPYLLTLPALALFVAIVLIPIAMTVLLSFHNWGQYKGIEPVVILKNWREVASDGYYREMFSRTLRIAVAVTLLTGLLGGPEAYILSRMRAPWRGIFLLVVLGPLLISVVARTLGWALLFGGSRGVINSVLIHLGVVSAPLPFMFTETGVVIALAHVLMPFMVLSVWAALQRLDPQIENAAASLGASQPVILRRIVLPQIMPGVLSGAIIVFALAASAFATPAIIGGRRLKVASTLAYDEFLNTLNWPLGAVVATILLLALIAIVVGSNRLVERHYAEVFR